jgi:dephospho-CoA kinase
MYLNKIVVNAPNAQQVKRFENKNKASDKRIQKTKTLALYTQKNINFTSVADQNHLRPKDLNNDARRKMRHPLEVT